MGVGTDGVMEYRRLGNSELRVSELCLGTMTFGEQNDLSEAHEQLDCALDHGVNLIDTAELYPVPAKAETYGRSESYIGSWLAKQRRDRVVLATKLIGPKRTLPWIREGRHALTRDNIREAVEDSLRRLCTDYIDLYQLHWPERHAPRNGGEAYDPTPEYPATPIAEQLAACAELIREGKLRYLGLCNETPWGITKFSEVARELGLPAPVSVQNAYNLLNRVFDTSHAEACRHEGVDLIAYSPLGFGLLTGKHREGPAQGSRLSLFDGFASRYAGQNVLAAASAYADIACEHGLTPVQLALAFVRSRWFVKTTIIGASRRSQLEENFRTLSITLDEETCRAIDRVHVRFPNPAP
jgi:aryl-alcohol dehydrogenase-like predicted oxidoreductase